MDSLNWAIARDIVRLIKATILFDTASLIWASVYGSSHGVDLPNNLRHRPSYFGERIMSSGVYPSSGGELSEEVLIGKLMRLVEDSDLTFYQIASLLGTSGTILRSWSN